MANENLLKEVKKEMFKELTKEEYENALYELSLIAANNTEDGSCLGCSCTSCLPNDKCLNGKLIGVFNNLIKEHFDNPPLKFEELKEGMWVWDNEQKKYLKIVDVIDYDEDFDEPAFFVVFEPNEYDCWCENRFYRSQLKGEDDNEFN